MTDIKEQINQQDRLELQKQINRLWSVIQEMQDDIFELKNE